MVFTNSIMTTHVNIIVNWPLMNLIDVGGYICTNVENPNEGYWKPSITIVGILNHRNGHYVWPNKVAFKYLDFKKDDPDAHVIMFNFAVKANPNTF
jgi:hypothetical protein